MKLFVWSFWKEKVKVGKGEIDLEPPGCCKSLDESRSEELLAKRVVEFVKGRYWLQVEEAWEMARSQDCHWGQWFCSSALPFVLAWVLVRPWGKWTGDQCGKRSWSRLNNAHLKLKKKSLLYSWCWCSWNWDMLSNANWWRGGFRCFLHAKSQHLSCERHLLGLC